MLNFRVNNSLRLIPLRFRRSRKKVIPSKFTTTAGTGTVSGSRGKNIMSGENKSSNSKSNIVYGSEDKLFGCIERNQEVSGKPFGTFLDAGTGTHSLRWMASLIGDNCKSSDQRIRIDGYTAITADEGMRKNVLKEATDLKIEDAGRIIIGNWQDEGGRPEENELCHGEMFDTILADYLVGAMDGFSPYYQDLIFPRLSRHLKPGGRIYVVGLNPIPHKTDGDANIFCEVTRLRDACILLGGHRCYRGEECWKRYDMILYDMILYGMHSVQIKSIQYQSNALTLTLKLLY